VVKSQRGIKIIEKNMKLNDNDVIFPQVVIYNNRKKETKINNIISKTVNDLIKEEFNDNNKVSTCYEIKLNRKELLSILFEARRVNGDENDVYTAVKSVTLDLRKSTLLKLQDLFIENSFYDYIINKIVKDNIENNDTPLLQEFSNLDQNNYFYLTEDSLVSYIPLLKDTNYASSYCTPEFNIPLGKIKGLLNPKSPVSKLFYRNISKYV
jgi:hypothetical protein